MRGLFAFFVALGHLFDIAQLNTGYGGVLALVRPCFGFQWVVGFFVLSGFCIESSVQHARDKSVRHYAVLRLSRLAPAYFAILALALAVEVAILGSPFRPPIWQNVSTVNFVGQVLVLQGSILFGLLAFGCYASTWTITYEAVYYALWALRVRYFRHTSALPLLVGGALIAYASARLFAYIPGARGLIPIMFAIALLAPYPALMNANWARWSVHAGHISYPLFLIHGVIGIGLGTMFNYIGGISFAVQFALLLAGSLAAAWAVVVLLERPLLLYRKQKLGGFVRDSDEKSLHAAQYGLSEDRLATDLRRVELARAPAE